MFAKHNHFNLLESLLCSSPLNAHHLLSVHSLCSAMSANLKNMQGDLFSRGFPKFNETYYFFSITSDNEKGKKFTQALVELGKKEISTLEKVLADWVEIDKGKTAYAAAKARDPKAKETIFDVSNALIAFSQAGLQKVSIPAGKHVNIMNADWNRLKISWVVLN